MADNVGITTGTGATVAADDIGGVQHQRVKLGLGADGSATDTPVAADDLTTAVPSGGLIWDSTAGAWKKARSAKSISDGDDGAKVPAAASLLWNEESSGWFRQRANYRVTLLASAARTAYTSSSVLTNPNARGVLLELNVTSAGSDSISLLIAAPSTVNTTPFGGVLTVNAAGVAAAPGATHSMLVYPGADESALWGSDYYLRKVVSAPLPALWYASVNPEAASSWTYSLHAHVLV